MVLTLTKAQCKILAHYALCKIKFLYNSVGETKQANLSKAKAKANLSRSEFYDTEGETRPMLGNTSLGIVLSLTCQPSQNPNAGLLLAKVKASWSAFRQS